ncbi:MAG: hypothetical protein NTV96_05155 [Actinobacteria bacterium]|nr:hypothetical protein [Actinomycetota bacterium]
MTTILASASALLPRMIESVTFSSAPNHQLMILPPALILLTWPRN